MAIHGADKSLNIGDITTADENAVSDFNTMFGGSPCQDFSIGGKQGGAVWSCQECSYAYNPLEVHYSERDKCPKCHAANIEKTRSSLLVEWLRFLRAKKPCLAVYENVKNIVGSRFKETFNMFVNELQEYGYNVYWKVLNAKDYCIPQNRERVYCVIIRKDVDNGMFQFPSKIPLTRKLKDLLEDNVDEKYYLSEAQVEAIHRSTYACKKSSISNGGGCTDTLRQRLQRPAMREVANAVRVGGRGSFDGRHTWDLITETK